MDLGLKQLSDDQLVELLQEACAELGTREHYVRTAAQNVIQDEAEKMHVFQRLLGEAVSKTRAQFVKQLEKEVYRWVESGVKDGSIRIVNPDQEAALLVEASQVAIEAIEHDVGAEVYAKSKAEIEANLKKMEDRAIKSGWIKPSQPFYRPSTAPPGGFTGVPGGGPHKIRVSKVDQASPDTVYVPAYHKAY